MPKIISNTKGITLDKDGQPQVDNSFEGPAYVVQDMGLGLLCERCKPWIFNLPEVGWGDFWVIPMTVEGFMGTLYYGTYSKDEVREIYESKGIGLI